VRNINGAIESLVYVPEQDREVYIDAASVEPIQNPRPDVMRVVRRYMTACRNGREAVLIGLYRAMVSVLADALGHEYSVTRLKESAANVINRLTFRQEHRPDPRGDDELGRMLEFLCSLQMVREASALVIILDVALGAYLDTVTAGERLFDAIRLAGPETEGIIKTVLHPRHRRTDSVESLTMTIAGVLSSIADGERVF